mgnify:CR=1 FL=1
MVLLRLLIPVIATALLAVAVLPATGAEYDWLGPNTSFCIGPMPPADYWADAYYSAPADYGDWTVGGGGAIDGDANFIWLRQQGQWAQATLTIGSTSVVVGFGSDANDGKVEVLIDGSTVAIVDSWSNPGVYWYVTTWNLPGGPHTIKVLDAGPSTQAGATTLDDDVSLDGAGIMPCTPVEEGTWSEIKALFRN